MQQCESRVSQLGAAGQTSALWVPSKHRFAQYLACEGLRNSLLNDVALPPVHLNCGW